MFLGEEKQETVTQSETYSPVISVDKTRLFGLPCIELSQVSSAIVSILLQVGSATSFLISLYTYKRSSSTAFIAYLNYMLATNGATITVYYMMICWVLTPLWQNVRFIHKSRLVDPSDNSSLQGDSVLPFVASSDPEDDDAMSVGLVEDGSLRGSMIRQTDIDGIMTKTKKKPNGFLCCLCMGACFEFCCLCRYTMLYKREKKITRYIPFSIYSLLNPGDRLNPQLPDHMERFGVARGMLFVTSTNAKGTFHMYLFIFAFVSLAAKYNNVDTNDDADMMSASFAVISLLCAAVKLRVFFLSTVFGLLLLPMNLGSYVALVWFDWCKVISPNNGTYFYKVKRYFWYRMSD